MSPCGPSVFHQPFGPPSGHPTGCFEVGDRGGKPEYIVRLTGIELAQHQSTMLFQPVDFGFKTDQERTQVVDRHRFEVGTVKPPVGK
jgi:hypothetical protein